MALYISAACSFVNFAYFVVLTPDEIALSGAVAVTFAERVLGPVAPIVPFLVGLSCFGTLNGEVMAPSRMFFAGARFVLVQASTIWQQHSQLKYMRLGMAYYLRRWP